MRRLSRRHPGQCLNGCSFPGQQTTNANGAKRAIFQAGPAAKCLRAAIQVVRGLGGREVRLGDLFKRQVLRGELLRGCSLAHRLDA